MIALSPGDPKDRTHPMRQLLEGPIVLIPGGSQLLRGESRRDPSASAVLGADNGRDSVPTFFPTGLRSFPALG